MLFKLRQCLVKMSIIWWYMDFVKNSNFSINTIGLAILIIFFLWYALVSSLKLFLMFSRCSCISAAWFLPKKYQWSTGGIACRVFVKTLHSISPSDSLAAGCNQSVARATTTCASYLEYFTHYLHINTLFKGLTNLSGFFIVNFKVV